MQDKEGLPPFQQGGWLTLQLAHGSSSPEPQPSAFSWKIIGMVYFPDAGLFFSPVDPDRMLNASPGEQGEAVAISEVNT